MRERCWWPGKLIHIDVKKLSRIPDSGGYGPLAVAERPENLKFYETPGRNWNVRPFHGAIGLLPVSLKRLALSCRRVVLGRGL